MTDNMFEQLDLAPAEEVEAAASDWLARRVSDRWNESDEAAFSEWLSHSPENRIAFLRLESAWSFTSRLGALRRPNRREAGSSSPRSRIMLRVAAAILLIAGGALAISTQIDRTSEKVYRTAVGGRETLKLADGSQIELNTNSVLRLTYGKNVRHAVLEHGEAYFQITHDAARPFTVETGNHRVTDLGTKFLIRNGNGSLEVAVTEGLVKLDGIRNEAKPALLKRGDVIVISDRSTERAHKPAQKLADELGWRRGVLIFENATVAQAAAQFNRYNTKKLIVAPSAAHIAIGGTFPSDNVETFTELAQDVLGLHIEERGDQILISR
jgi:transmembrane sensor